MDIEDRDALALDGNAAAGLLRELFALEMTTAVVTCGGCGAVAPLGGAALYGGSMGAILRCVHCDTAVLRLTRTPLGLFLDLQGSRVLHVPTREAAAKAP